MPIATDLLSSRMVPTGCAPLERRLVVLASAPAASRVATRAAMIAIRLVTRMARSSLSPSPSRSWPRHALPDARRDPGAAPRRLRLRDDQGLRPQLRERDARVDGPALVEHLVRIAIGENAPVERRCDTDVLDVRPDRGGAVVGERVVPRR